MSYSRVKEVQRDYPNLETFEELVELMQGSLDDVEISARHVSRKPAGYTNLEGLGVLPDWAGILFLVTLLINFYSISCNKLK